MSDFIMPTQQWPIPCDFGPFAGGYCGKVVSIDFRQAKTNIQVADLELELNEYNKVKINLLDLVVSNMPIDWTLTAITPPSEGTINYAGNGELEYIPDIVPSEDRFITIKYTVMDNIGGLAEGNIKIKILDFSPVLTTNPVSVSGTENDTFTIDLTKFILVMNTTMDYTKTDSIVLATPSEGTATVTNGIVTYKPSTLPSNNRVISFNFTAKDVSGLTSTNKISISITDMTAVLTLTDITKTILNTSILTGSILSNMVIKNDSFDKLTFGTIAAKDGTIVANGSNFTFTPPEIVISNYTLNIPYTITTKSGLTQTANLKINVTYDNPWLKTVWYGNSEITPTQSIIESAFKSVVQPTYLGTFAWTVESMKYKWFVYPKSYGINPVILDSVTGFPIAGMEELYTYITIQGVELVVFKTYNIINGNLSVKIAS